MHLLATEHPFRWQPHPEIWVLMVGILGLAVYAVRVIGPRGTLVTLARSTASKELLCSEARSPTPAVSVISSNLKFPLFRYNLLFPFELAVK